VTSSGIEHDEETTLDVHESDTEVWEVTVRDVREGEECLSESGGGSVPKEATLTSTLTGKAKESAFCDDCGEGETESGTGNEGLVDPDLWRGACGDGDFCYVGRWDDMFHGPLV